MTPHEVLSLKISELEESIKAATPGMSSLLRDIHQSLKLDPDQVTILSPEQVSVIVAGLSKQTQTTIVTSIMKQSKGKSLKSIGMDDV